VGSVGAGKSTGAGGSSGSGSRVGSGVGSGAGSGSGVISTSGRVSAIVETFSVSEGVGSASSEKPRVFFLVIAISLTAFTGFTPVSSLSSRES